MNLEALWNVLHADNPAGTTIEDLYSRAMNAAFIPTADRLRSTLGNPQWLAANRAAITSILPTDWKPAIDYVLPIGYRLKLLGVEWSTESELIKIMDYLQRIHLIDTRILSGRAELKQWNELCTPKNS